ncbi:hypothetical protein BpOF4_02845 [Alkalihalophilus pseudofirmus OF4]|uniref:Fimbrial assembly family protein n=1 Tax=Alkalihalophilus pseudofirmus (strain ATCC BAA-2126 / JCM 17055 / OF4) TaxID=398511 RepID=D3FWA4_ALKPO|nr:MULTISPECIES: hypothetical protein [Alkalihalophilus]ADC48636.1 hypothetical protein BpOF4_02845 [Alkalihalophilus pseudofirmus OF4]MED1602931.1 hypothetical protein [Alkalihalophilus marmarensis]
MLVEVNLLPEKPKKNYTSILYAGAFLFLLLLAVLTTFLFQRHLTQEVQEVNEQVYNVQLESAQIRQELTGLEWTDAKQIDSAASAVEGQIVPASSVASYIVSLLPERGFIQYFTYTQPHSILVDVHFDRLEEIAQYHEALESSSLTTSVRLSVIDSHEMLDDEQHEINFDEVKSRYLASFELTLDREEGRVLGDEQ